MLDSPPSSYDSVKKSLSLSGVSRWGMTCSGSCRSTCLYVCGRMGSLSKASHAFSNARLKQRSNRPPPPEFADAFFFFVCCGSAFLFLFLWPSPPSSPSSPLEEPPSESSSASPWLSSSESTLNSDALEGIVTNDKSRTRFSAWSPKRAFFGVDADAEAALFKERLATFPRARRLLIPKAPNTSLRSTAPRLSSSRTSVRRRTKRNMRPCS
mmetsp:Transcript_52540/g.104309  ORF Transcript_52540/g.104309 Transcript_52540/m.104309 type:complete len:211 (-) Transcript_52540:402-1034(-)